MRKFKIIGILLLVASFTLVACEDWVLNTEDQIDIAEEELLDDPAEIPFLITGVEARFAFTWTRLGLVADLTADQLIFDEVIDLATFPTYRDISANFRGTGGQTILTNNTVRNAYNPLNNWRLMSDDLLERIDRIQDDLDEGTFGQASYTGNFYGAVSRYMLGFYFEDFGCGEGQGVGQPATECIDNFGAPIDRGPVIRSGDMAVNEVLPRLELAESFATDDYQVRKINTLRARMHLFLGNYQEAFDAASNGLEPGDDPFQSQHNVQAANEYFFSAGDGRIQVIPEYRFAEYIEADPDEANRILIRQAPANLVVIPDGAGDPDEPRFQQDMYPVQESPMDFLTWQENHLMLAELAALHGFSGDAEAMVNEVRGSHDIGPISGPVDEQLIIEERDKELFLMGLRMFDQLRFGVWHEEVQGTPTTGRVGQPSGEWRGIPIPNDERNDNPCVEDPNAEGC